MPRFNPSRFMACSRRVVSLRDSIKTDADGIHCDSRVGHCHFRLFVQGYGASCVKSDGIPDKLDLLFRDTAILQERARRVRAVNFKPILRSVAIEHLFPPYTEEKVKALSQWFEY